jgi:hypothetical protein
VLAHSSPGVETHPILVMPFSAGANFGVSRKAGRDSISKR